MKKIIVLLEIMLMLVFVGCSQNESDKKADETEKLSVMNIPFEEVSEIELYSMGEKTSISLDSEVAKNILVAIEESEGQSGMLDLLLELKGDYEAFSKKKMCDVYLFKFKENQSIDYANCSVEENVSGVFVIPNENLWGPEIQVEGQDYPGYASISNLEEDVFGDIMK